MTNSRISIMQSLQQALNK